MCKVPNCQNDKIFAKGWCCSHYKHWWKYGDPLAGGTPKRFSVLRSADVITRFWAQTIVNGECREFLQLRSPNRKNSYGTFKANGKRYAAHRFIWEVVRGPIPAGKQLNHTCDNTKCVRIDHLWLGTQSENIKDAYRKGRIIPPRSRAK